MQIQSTPTVASSTPSQGSRPDTGVYSQSITASTKSVRSARTSNAGDATSITKEINSSKENILFFYIFNKYRTKNVLYIENNIYCNQITKYRTALIMSLQEFLSAYT